MIWFVDETDKEPRLMLTKRRKACKTYVNYYAAVGGGVEQNECAIKAAEREIMEETGFYVPMYGLNLIDCYVEGDLKCFIFQCVIAKYRFKDIKNKEPEKHTKWKLYSVDEALALPKLMPALQEILLTMKQVRPTIKPTI